MAKIPSLPPDPRQASTTTPNAIRPKKLLKSAARSDFNSSGGRVPNATPTPRSKPVRNPRTPSLLCRKGSKMGQSGSSSQIPFMTPQTSNAKLNQTEEEDERSSLRLYDNFSIEGISQEELQYWSQFAPEGHKLEDVASSPKRKPDLSGFFQRMLLTPVCILFGSSNTLVPHRQIQIPCRP
jgi:hypothetical protein